MSQIAMRTLEEIGVSFDKHIKGAGEEIIAAGQDLIEARKQAKHGQWEKWLEERGTTPRFAQKLMHVANTFRNARHVAHFSAAILIELSAKNVEPIREQLVSRIEDGENFSVHDIRRAARAAARIVDELDRLIERAPNDAARAKEIEEKGKAFPKPEFKPVAVEEPERPIIARKAGLVATALRASGTSEILAKKFKAELDEVLPYLTENEITMLSSTTLKAANIWRDLSMTISGGQRRHLYEVPNAQEN
jgi:hypothetical protein